MRYTFALSALAIVLFAATFQVAATPQESMYCDNSGAKDSGSRFHHCDCNKATDMCDADHPKQAANSKCKTYCREDHCDCSTESCS
jgi:hypothetical protein